MEILWVEVSHVWVAAATVQQLLWPVVQAAAVVVVVAGQHDQWLAGATGGGIQLRRRRPWVGQWLYPVKGF